MKSVSQEAEARRENDHEKGRKSTSPNKKDRKKKYPEGTYFGRDLQRKTSVGEGNQNVGSNRNAGRKSEQECAPECVPAGGGFVN